MILVYVVLCTIVVQARMVLANNSTLNFTKFCNHVADIHAMHVRGSHYTPLLKEVKSLEKDLKNKNGKKIDLNKLCQDARNRDKVECIFLKRKQITVENGDWHYHHQWSNDFARIYYHLWLLHPALRDCVKQFDIPINETLAKQKLLRDLYTRIKDWKILLEKQHRAFGIKNEVEELCAQKNFENDIFCEGLPEMMRIADTFKLVRNLPKKGPKWNAYGLNFAMLTYLKPAQYFVFITPSKIHSLIQNIFDQVFEYVLNRNTADLRKFMILLPLRSTSLHCDNPSTTDAKSVCLFWDVVSLIRMYLGSTSNAPDGLTTKLLNTNIDYQEFLGGLDEMETLVTVIEQHHQQIKALEKMGKWVVNEVVKNGNERFKGLRDYFQKVATFSKMKSNADVLFIKGRLDVYKNRTTTLSNRLAWNMKTLLHLAFAIMAGETAEDTTQLILAGIVVANPLEKIFNGGSILDIVDRVAKLANSISKIVKLTKVSQKLNKILNRRRSLTKELNKNDDFLSTVHELIESIDTNVTSIAYKKNMERFLESYRGYDPKPTRPEIRALESIFTELIQTCCDAIDGTQTAVAGITKAVAYAKKGLICPESKELADELFETFNEIYDFQFELMEAMARFMEGATAENAAVEIGRNYVSKTAVLHLSADNYLKRLTSTAYVFYKIHIWGVSEEYCDILAYKEGGKAPKNCLSMDVKTLKSYVSPICTPGQTYCDVPTRNKNNHMTSMNLTDLYAGRTVYFKIPDAQWLVRNNWISKQDQDFAIFVKRFDVYLPTSSNVSRRARVEVKVAGENKLSPNSNTKYTIMPPKEFISEYFEDHNNTCISAKQVQSNPYGKSLPKLCRINIDGCSDGKTALFPSVYSEWKISMSGYESVPAPKLANDDFKLKVGVGLCILRQPSEHDQVIKQDQADGDDSTRRPSCSKHQYWSSSRKRCANCPKGSKPALDGYFCEN